MSCLLGFILEILVGFYNIKIVEGIDYEKAAAVSTADQQLMNWLIGFYSDFFNI